MAHAFKRSPLAPTHTPDLPAIAGVEIISGSMGLYGQRDDFFIAHFPAGASAAGVFTTSATASADVLWCRKSLSESQGVAHALVVNAGNSNAFTGRAGEAKNAATVAAASRLAGCQPSQVFLAATGVIGVPMRAEQLAEGVEDRWPDLGKGAIADAARAFMTTDTFMKTACTTASMTVGQVQIAGIAKGSGMIAPNMATMLSYVFTDANIAPSVLQALVADYADQTFNCITVDGDTSTSDSLMVFATGAVGGPQITSLDDPDLAGFAAALKSVLKDLALQIVRDGEGATKLIEITVTGAKSDKAAKTIAASIANSPLVKTALAASDANWGRIVMAVGKAGEAIDPDSLSIRFGDVEVARKGMRAPDYSEEAASAECARQEISILVDVGVGEGKATVWTCDLTHAYVDINGAYRT